MKTITLKTHKKREVVDITEELEQFLKEEFSAGSGLCTVFLTHTTAALITADMDPGADEDMLDAFNKLIPDIKFRHPHNPEHMPDHILSAMLGGSLSLLVDTGKIVLGTWQRIVLVEFDGPRERNIVVSFQKNSKVKDL